MPLQSLNRLVARLLGRPEPQEPKRTRVRRNLHRLRPAAKSFPKGWTAKPSAARRLF